MPISATVQTELTNLAKIANSPSTNPGFLETVKQFIAIMYKAIAANDPTTAKAAFGQAVFWLGTIQSDPTKAADAAAAQAVVSPAYKALNLWLANPSVAADSAAAERAVALVTGGAGAVEARDVASSLPATQLPVYTQALREGATPADAYATAAASTDAENRAAALAATGTADPMTIAPPPQGSGGGFISYPTSGISGPLPLAPSSKLGLGPDSIPGSIGPDTPYLDFGPTAGANPDAAVGKPFPWLLLLGAGAVLYFLTKRS